MNSVSPHIIITTYFRQAVFRQVEPYIVLLKKNYVRLTVYTIYLSFCSYIILCLWHSMVAQSSVQCSVFLLHPKEAGIFTFNFHFFKISSSDSGNLARYCCLMCTICSILQGEAIIHTIQFCLPVSCDFCCTTLLPTVCLFSVFLKQFCFVFLFKT